MDNRQEQILDLVRRTGFTRIEVLAERFGVSAQTVRRDVRALCDSGLLRRHHGGVGLMQFSGNLDYERRRILRLPEKHRIAETVARIVPDGASLFLGIGTTPQQVAQALTGHHDLLVVTNNLGVAEAFAGSNDCSVILPGGKVRNRHRDLITPAAAELYATYRVDFAIVGVGGIDPDGTLLDFDGDEVRARQAMADNARCRVLVADHTKHGRRAPARGGHITDIDRVVTDRALPATLQRTLDAAGVAVSVADSLASESHVFAEDTAHG